MAMLGADQPGRRGHRLRAVLRELRPDAILAGAVPRFVPLHEPDWSFDPDELRAAFSPRTRAIVLNSPHNPTGKVFSRDGARADRRALPEYDVLAITDEIYEHIVYDGEHIPLATLPGMAERTVTINAMSKTYSVTGWRVGWMIAPPDLTDAIRQVHDFLTVGAAAPLQEAGVVASACPALLRRARRRLPRRGATGSCRPCEAAGFRVHDPAGAYYVMTDIPRR